MKPLLVGELNPYGSDPAFALYPLPRHASGGRLAEILGLSRTEYLRTFDRANLCDGRWSMYPARVRAKEILRVSMEDEVGRTIVLLGAKVCSAFYVDYEPFTSIAWLVDPVVRTVVLPHPSGLSRKWNEPGAAELARKAVFS